MGSITRTSSGTIHLENTWASCPSWFTEVQDTPGRITYGGGEATLTAPGGTYAFFTTTDGVSVTNRVLRIKMQRVSGDSYRSVMFRTATRPTGPLALVSDVYKALCYGSYGGPVIGTDDAYFSGLFSVGDDTTAYWYEWVLNDPNITYALRHLNMSVMGSHSFAVTYLAPPFAAIGNFMPTTFGESGTFVVSCAHLFTSNSITMTGLGAGNAARIYNATGDVVLASGVESSGTATLDCSLVDWNGLSCYLKAFEDDTYASVLATSSTLTDASGGDVYHYAGALYPIVLTYPADHAFIVTPDYFRWVIPSV